MLPGWCRSRDWGVLWHGRALQFACQLLWKFSVSEDLIVEKLNLSETCAFHGEFVQSCSSRFGCKINVARLMSKQRLRSPKGMAAHFSLRVNCCESFLSLNTLLWKSWGWVRGSCTAVHFLWLFDTASCIAAWMCDYCFVTLEPAAVWFQNALSTECVKGIVKSFGYAFMSCDAGWPDDASWWCELVTDALCQVFFGACSNQQLTSSQPWVISIHELLF